jgi:putative ABC transport system permease protein
MDSMVQILLVVLLCLAAIGLLEVRRKTLAKMAMRNIVRKKKYTVIVTAGLLIATAMISGALVMADTLDYVIKQDTYERTGAVDIVVTAKDAAGQSVYFDETVARDLIRGIADGNLSNIDGAQPAIRELVGVLNEANGLPYPDATLFGFEPNASLDPLLDENKNPIDDSEIWGDKVVINKALAEELNAVTGDTIVIMPPIGLPKTVRISHIAYDSGMARWQNEKLVFVNLTYAQLAVVLEPYKINAIDVSNAGSISKGYKLTDAAIEDLEGFLPNTLTYDYLTIKQDGIEEAETTSEQVSQIFVIMSSFTIIAGVALIINIFVMLAEERKPEMGISRAIGMQRGDLTQSFVFEGVVYALMAAVIGALVGLVIALVMFGLFSTIFGGGFSFSLHFKLSSLIIACCAGFLITLLTVGAASWRVSKLNIVRAIRDIPEPVLAKSGKKYFVTGIAGLAFGLLLFYGGVTSKQAGALDAGPSLIALGASMVLIRYVHPRWPFTISGAFIIWWVLDPTDLRDVLFGETTSGLEMFIITGTLLVIAGVVVVMFNSDALLEGLMRLFGRRRSLLPVFRVAISYPLNKKFRTGLTLFIFALIMFTVTVLAMIASFQRESVDATTQQFSGGFELTATSIKDIPEDVFDTGIQDLVAAGAIDRYEPSLTAPISIMKAGSDESVPYNMLGMSDSMLEQNRFSLADRSDEYASDEAVWQALEENSSLAVIDGSVRPQIYGPSFGVIEVEVGEQIALVMSNGSMVNVTIIGIMDQSFNLAVFTSNDFMVNNSPVLSRNLFYISTSKQSGWTDQKVAQELEKRFIEFGLRVYVVRDLIKTVMDSISSIMQLMEVFLGMGLIVGISGLGIITIRSVAERRQEIGVMRSIGYQRDMILKTFMLETSFVSLLGIALGVILGLLLSYRLWEWGGFAKNAPFVIPWVEILILIAIAFLITLAATMPPSRSASRLAPAEALRRVD